MSPLRASPVPAADSELTRTLGLDGRARALRWVKWSITAVVVLAFVGFGGWGVQRWRAPEAVSWETAPVVLGELHVTVTTTGILEPLNVVDVGAEISGLVRAVHVDFNDPVVKGQPLAELDTALLEARVEEAEAQLAMARASVVEARVALDDASDAAERARSLHVRGVITEVEMKAANTTLERARVGATAARAQVSAAGAALHLAKTSLAKAVIRSPIDGVVLARNVEVGQTVVSEFTSVVMFRIAEDLERMRAHVDVDEADVAKIAVGQSATFRVAAFPDRDFAATVVSIRNAPRIPGTIVTYEALLDVDNPDGVLRPGMTVTASVETTVYEGALLIPNAALRFWPPELEPSGESGPGTEPTVWKLGADGKPASVVVSTGASNELHTVVDPGPLDPDDLLIVGTQ